MPNEPKTYLIHLLSIIDLNNRIFKVDTSVHLDSNLNQNSKHGAAVYVCVYVSSFLGGVNKSHLNLMTDVFIMTEPPQRFGDPRNDYY